MPYLCQMFEQYVQTKSFFHEFVLDILIPLIFLDPSKVIENTKENSGNKFDSSTASVVLWKTPQPQIVENSD